MARDYAKLSDAALEKEVAKLEQDYYALHAERRAAVQALRDRQATAQATQDVSAMPEAQKRALAAALAQDAPQGVTIQLQPLDVSGKAAGTDGK